MPFRDRDWEDFQRDCDFFPAYTDYLFGVDTRPQVADEPGLHPQILSPSPSRPQRLQGLPPPVQYPVTFDPARDSAQIRPYNTPTPRPRSLLRHESSSKPILPTPCPAPRVSPSTGPPTPLLQANDLISDPQYSSVPFNERVATNLRITQAWSILSSDADRVQKVKAMEYLQKVSHVAAAKRQKYHAREAARLDAEGQAGQGLVQDEARQAQADLYPQMKMEHAEKQASAAHEYAMHDLHDISYLPAHVQLHLPRLWSSTQIIALQAPPIDSEQTNAHQKALQYVTSFMQTVPPKGRPWVNAVMDGMIKLRRQGGDPLTVLQSMPGVEEY
ncbi:hypothetical protein OPT61_g2363 [Boeremia exigua]|uniref:Uncharacterized protein n=1 Tax=Boeremia exigua TaxID=749465 RepID=A0ACC2IM68_9PLEO|nr:hypothetical protein OPT61_g2363 [Boeremia exigua]